MNGFPPSPKNQVTLANWRTPPFHKWGFQHVRELVPSADIPASGDTMELPSNPVDLSICQIDHADGRSMTFNDFLEHTHTDGIVILRGGDIVFGHDPTDTAHPDVGQQVHARIVSGNFDRTRGT